MQQILEKLRKLYATLTQQKWLHLLNPKQWKFFAREQKREWSELVTGKQTVQRFAQDSWQLFRDAFIPTDHNQHKPKALRAQPLAWYAMTAVVVKVAATGVLFFFYPTPAELATIVSGRMVALVNQARQEEGIDQLAVSGALAGAAQAKGADMFDKQYFAHDTPDGKRPWQWIDRNAYDYLYAGENLAIDFTSAEMAHQAFMKSPSHRRNILLPQYKDIGVAVLHGEMKGRDTILVVNFFGTQRADAVRPATTQPRPTPEATRPAAPAAEVLPERPVQQPTQPAQPSVTQPPVEQQPTAVIPEPAPTQINPTIQEPQALGSANPAAEEPLIQGYSSEGAITVSTTQLSRRTVMDIAIAFTEIFLGAFMLFMVISLMINVMVKIRIQHASVIFQSIAVIALLAALLTIPFHFAETIPHELLIL